MARLWSSSVPGTELSQALRAWHTAKTDEARVAVTTAFPQLLATLKHDGVVAVSVFSPDGSRIITASYDHTARIWNSADGSLLATLDHADKVTFAAFSPQETELLPQVPTIRHEYGAPRMVICLPFSVAI